jgi:hypothetical protein
MWVALWPWVWSHRGSDFWLVIWHDLSNEKKTWDLEAGVCVEPEEGVCQCETRWVRRINKVSYSGSEAPWESVLCVPKAWLCRAPGVTGSSFPPPPPETICSPVWRLTCGGEARWHFLPERFACCVKTLPVLGDLFHKYLYYMLHDSKFVRFFITALKLVNLVWSFPCDRSLMINCPDVFVTLLWPCNLTTGTRKLRILLTYSKTYMVYVCTDRCVAIFRATSYWVIS